MKSPCCLRTSCDTCTSCGRPLCAWHRALSPVAINGRVHMLPVCHPVCTAEWWALTPGERAKTEAHYEP